MNFTLVSRGGWGARPPRFAIATDADETFQHHTAGGHRGATDVRAIQNFHMDIRGWSDIAYNFLIDRFTNVVYEGRGWGVRPGSQKNYNTGTWSVCLMGDFRSAVPTKANLATVAALVRHGENLGHIPRVLTGGHKDAPGQSTQCPGVNLYSEIPTIRRLLAKEDTVLPINAQSHKEEIRHVQEMLRVEASGDWDFVAVVSALAQRAGTGDPKGHSGEHINGRMYTHLLGEFIGRHSAGGAHDHDGRYLTGVEGIK